MLWNKSNLHFPLLGRYKSCLFCFSAELTGLLIISEGPLVLLVDLPRGLEGGLGAASRTPPAPGACVPCQGVSLQLCREARGEGSGAPPP